AMDIWEDHLMRRATKNSIYADAPNTHQALIFALLLRARPLNFPFPYAEVENIGSADCWPAYGQKRGHLKPLNLKGFQKIGGTLARRCGWIPDRVTGTDRRSHSGA